MERFSDELRSKFEDTERLNQIEASYERLITLKRPAFYIPDLFPEATEENRVPRLPFKLLVWMQVAIRRALELTDSLIRDANAYSFAPVWTMSRSIFELGALVYDMKERVRVRMGEPWNLATFLELDQHVSNVMLGWKAKDWQPPTPPEILLEAKNVLTMIGRIGKHVEGYRELYDLLSEVVHPNYAGMLEQYHQLSDDSFTATFIDSPAVLDLNRAIAIPMGPAVGSLVLLVNAVGWYDENFKHFVVFVEKNLPPDVEVASRS